MKSILFIPSEGLKGMLRTDKFNGCLPQARRFDEVVNDEGPLVAVRGRLRECRCPTDGKWYPAVEADLTPPLVTWSGPRALVLMWEGEIQSTAVWALSASFPWESDWRLMLQEIYTPEEVHCLAVSAQDLGMGEAVFNEETPEKASDS